MLAKYSANRCRVTNIAPCVNTADDANYVKLSPKAQLKENFSSTEQRIKRELVVPKTSSLRALVWLRHMTIHVEICCSSWKPQYLEGRGHDGNTNYLDRIIQLIDAGIVILPILPQQV